MLVIDLRDDKAQVQAITGGKGASLARIHALNVPSPEGFCITTEAYSDHLHHLSSQVVTTHIINATGGQATLETHELAHLRTAIISTEVSSTLQEAIKVALQSLETHAQHRPVRLAVRSSATAEDLPNASFAGQHDTFLNVTGEAQLFTQIKYCWASFWSERAYYYRIKNNVDHWQHLMAVVIEELVPSEAAGTLFMANPVTKNGNEAVIEASWGLGEMVVKGAITPDIYYVRLNDNMPVITRKVIKTKRRMLRPHLTEQGGTIEEDVSKERSTRQVLSEEVILELIQLGFRLSKYYGHPPDIEWALSAGRLSILQARPITTLQQVPHSL